jgi:alpha-beta hydrolase superfamily lysophospholipase
MFWWVFFGLNACLVALSYLFNKPIRFYNGKPITYTNSQAVVFKENMEKPSTYLVNSRKQKIYYRISLPPIKPPRATLFFTHGLGAHTNRRTYKWFIYHLNQLGLAVVCWDHEGHGYSDGRRGYMEDHHLLVEDGVEVIKQNLEKIPEIQSIPFFVGGHSLGGALSVLIGEQFQQLKNATYSHYRGTVLLSPAVLALLPPKWILTIINRVIVPCMPTRCVPSFLDPTGKMEDSFIYDADIDYALRDSDLYPGGLTQQRPLLFKTASTIIKMLQEINHKIKQGTFHSKTLICHDPNDKICLFQGSQELMASLHQAGVHGSSLLVFQDKRHDLMANCVQELVEQINSWIEKDLEALVDT